MICVVHVCAMYVHVFSIFVVCVVCNVCGIVGMACNVCVCVCVSVIVMYMYVGASLCDVYSMNMYMWYVYRTRGIIWVVCVAHVCMLSWICILVQKTDANSQNGQINFKISALINIINRMEYVICFESRSSLGRVGPGEFTSCDPSAPLVQSRFNRLSVEHWLGNVVTAFHVLIQVCSKALQLLYSGCHNIVEYLCYIIRSSFQIRLNLPPGWSWTNCLLTFASIYKTKLLFSLRAYLTYLILKVNNFLTSSSSTWQNYL